MSEVAVARPEGDRPGHHSGVPAAAWQAPDTARCCNWRWARSGC